MRTARDSKPVTAQIDGVAMSAGFWLASQASQIFATQGSTLGSIGVILPLLDFSAAFEQMGVKAVPIDTGEFKHMGMMGTEITEEHQAHLQTIVDARFAEFLSAVSKGRGMTPTAVKKLADGRLFVPADARTSGLIDGIRTVDQTIAKLAKPSTRRRTMARVATMDL